MKRLGIEAIYLGGWATSAKGSIAEDPGPDLASYPLSQVPDEAAGLVRALLTADRNQHFARVRMDDERRADQRRRSTSGRSSSPTPTRATGVTRHVRNLVRRFVEVGVPGYHIEDQKPGAKKCGHQAGKVLVAQDEQNKRLNAARFQLDIMRVPGIIVARTDAESATFLDNRSDERDQPFILGATNLDLPSYRIGFLAILETLHDLGLDDVRGHLLFAVPDGGAAGGQGLARARRSVLAHRAAGPRPRRRISGRRHHGRAPCSTPSTRRYAEVWRTEAGLDDLRRGGRGCPRARGWRGRALRHDARGLAHVRGRRLVRRGPDEADSLGHPRRLGSRAAQDRRTATTRSRAGSTTRSPSRSPRRRSPTCCGWRPRPPTSTMPVGSPRRSTPTTRTRCWPTTSRRRSTGTRPGLSDDEMRRFPEELGKLGFVFNFITYGGHQIDGLAAEEFATGPARGRHARARPPPAEVPAARVPVPHAAVARRRRSARRRPDGGLGPDRGDEGDGQGLDAAPAPRPDGGPDASSSRAGSPTWAQPLGAAGARSASSCGRTPPAPTCSSCASWTRVPARPLANVIFASIAGPPRPEHPLDPRPEDRAVDPRRRLMTLVQLFLIHRYRRLLGPLPDADRGQPGPDRADAGARHLLASSGPRSARSSSPTSTASTSPSSSGPSARPSPS